MKSNSKAPKKLKVFTANADVLTKDKMAELRRDAKAEQPDIIAISEVKPKNYEKVRTLAEYKIKGYTPEPINIDTKETGRGMIIYINEALCYTRVPLDKILEKNEYPEEAIAIEMKLKDDKKLLFCLFYRSPNSPPENDKRLRNMIRKLSNGFEYVQKCFVGDGNYPNINWETCSTLHDRLDNDFEFIECLRDSYLHQHVVKPTRARGTDTPHVLDLVMTDDEHNIEKLSIGAPLGRSDHAVITFDLICEPEEAPPKIIPQYDKGDYKAMKDMLDIDWPTILDEHRGDANSQWTVFEQKYREAEKECIPRKIIKTGTKCFSHPLDSKTLAKKRKKYHLWRRFLETTDGQIYTEYKRVSNQLRNLTRKCGISHEKDIASKAKTQPKYVWQHINNLRTVKSKIPDLYWDDDEDPNNMARTDHEKADRLADFFSSVMTHETDGVWELYDKPEIKHDLKIEINEDIVMKKLEKLNVSKSPGPDTIHPRVLKELKKTLVVPLTIIFQTSLETCVVPDSWKIAHISAIFKKKDKNVAGNYRPVSLTSVVCKLMESIIRDSMVDYMKKNDLFTDKQFGFIGGRSTVLQLLKCLDKWTDILDRGGVVDVVYCDFQKAFDTVPHKRLLHVLNHYGIPDPVLGWVKAFLSNRKQRVFVNGVPSSWHDVISGIPQGSVLGPVLFVIFINTIVDVIDYVDSALFADDTKLSNGIFSPEDRLPLQIDLNNIGDWSDESLLKFHPGKMIAMRLALAFRSYDLDPPYYSMKGTHIKVEREETDLGVIIDDNLTFQSHMQAKISKANSIMGLIRRSFQYLDNDMFRMLFTALVRPHVEYANAVWAPSLLKDITAIENVQRRATKCLYGMKDLSYEDRLRLLDLPTLRYRRYRGDMIECFKITHNLYDPAASAGLLPMAPPSGLRRHKYHIERQDYKYEIRKNFFSLRVENQWNHLPDSVVNAKTVKCFEGSLDRMWKAHAPEVLYDIDCDLNGITSSRTVRYY